MKKFFVIKGTPKGKERPRFNKVTGRVYTPRQTKDYQEMIRWEYVSQCGCEKFEGPVEAVLECYFPIPKTVKKDISGEPYTKKCDVDNIAKGVLDSLNGIAYDDDKQVYRLVVEKSYGKEPRIDVTLSNM